jgi:hypothetical protein
MQNSFKNQPTRTTELLLAIAGIMSSLAVRENSKVPKTFEERLREELGEDGAVRLLLRQYSGPKRPEANDLYPVVPVLQWDLLTNADGRDTAALHQWWKNVRKDREPDLRGGMLAGAGELTSWEEDLSDPNASRPPLKEDDEIVATFSAWREIDDDMESLAIEFETDDCGMVVGSLLVRATKGKDGSNRLLEDVRSYGAQLARTAVRQYWTAWDGHWARMIQEAITKATPIMTGEPNDHVELFNEVSKQLQEVLVPIANALSSPTVALFVPVGTDAMGLLSAHGYQHPLPRRLPEYKKGLTGLLCTILVPEIRSEGSRPMAYTCEIGRQVLAAYRELKLYVGDLEPAEADAKRDAEVYVSDRTIEPSLRPRVLQGPWAWAPLRLERWGEPRGTRLEGNIGLPVQNRLWGVLKITGRSRCELDRPRRSGSTKDSASSRSEWPSPFSRRERRRIHAYADLLSLVVQRLVDVGAARLREHLLRTVARNLADDTLSDVAQSIRHAMAADACFVLASPRLQSSPQRQLMSESYEPNFDRRLIEDYRNPRYQQRQAASGRTTDVSRPVVWRGHGVELVIFNPAEEIPAGPAERDQSGTPSLIQIWQPMKESLLAMLAFTRGSLRGSPPTSHLAPTVQRRHGDRTGWGEALELLCDAAMEASDFDGAAQKERLHSIATALLRLHVTFRTTKALADSVGLSPQHTRKLLVPVFERVQGHELMGKSDPRWDNLRRTARDQGYAPFEHPQALRELLSRDHVR